jgi:signal transduction histidine kinase
MIPTLRSRILLTLVPLLALLAVIGGAGATLLSRLGGRIDLILRDNYDSVLYMERLNEALERIDTSFQFTLAGREGMAREQYAQNWKAYYESLREEQANITLPGEAELVEQLTALTKRYRQQGEAFYAQKDHDQRQRGYFDNGGLLDTFKQIKLVSGQILRLNQENMEQASRDAKATAASSIIGFGVGLGVTAALAAGLAWSTLRAILRPIQAVTQSVQAIGAGNLDQVVPVVSSDELGQLAAAFNHMARQLRQYRQSSYARLLRVQQTSQATVDSFPDPLLVVDAEGQVEMANPAAQRLLGVVARLPETATGLPWQPPEALRQPLQEAVREQRAYLPEGFDTLVPLTLEGQEHAFLPRILPIRDPDGGTLGAAVLLQDVTRFRLLDQVKSNLVATVSHELKTPLTSIRLAVHLLLEETVGPLTAKQTELLLDARENAERLVGMVNNLLDLARLEQGRAPLELRPEPPAQLLQNAAEAARPRAEDKGIEVHVEAAPDLPPIAADADRLSHALSNLLDNAVSCTERGGTITLSASAADGAVTLTVADTGCGIPTEALPQVFSKFFRIPGRSPGGGTGLGLAIVHEIVTAHGGSVACESTLGAGTQFHLRLPVWSGEPLP